MIRSQLSSAWQRYAAAILFSLLGFGLSAALGEVLEPIPSLVPFAAVFFAAWFGGLGPGLLAGLLGALVVNYVFIDPAFRLGLLAPWEIERLLVFLALAVAVSVLSGRRRRVEAELRQRVLQLQTTQRLSQALTQAATPAEFYAEALANVKQTVSADHAAILTFDETGVLQFRAWNRLSEGYRRAVQGHLPWPPGTTDFRPVIIPDVARDARLGALRDVVLGEGIYAVAFIPLLAQNRLVGKFVLYCDRPYTFSPDEIELAQTIGRHLALVIERREAEDARRESERRLQLALRHAPLIVFHQDRDLRYTWVQNPTPDFTPADLIGRREDEVLSPDDAARLAAIKRPVLETGEGVRTEVVLNLPIGIRCFDLTVEPLRDANGAITGLTCAAIDITERMHTEATLRRQAELLDLADEAIIAWELSGTIIYWNRGAEHLYGYTRDEALGRLSAELLATEPAGLAQAIPAQLEEQGEWSGELIHLTRDGQRLTVESRMVLVTEPGGRRLVLESNRDMTQRKQAELALQAAKQAAEQAAHQARRAAERTARLQALTAALSQALAPSDVIEALTREGASLLGAVTGSLLMLSEDGQVLELVGSIGHSAAVRQRYQRIPLSAPSPQSTAVQTRQPVWLPARQDWLDQYPHMVAALDEQQLQASAVLPLLAGDRILGVLGVSFREPQDFPAADREFLETLAVQCAQALDRARLYAAEQSARRVAEQAAQEAHAAADHIARLQVITALFSQALSPEEVAQVVMDQGLAALAATAGSVVLLDEERDELRIVRAAGYPPEMLQAYNRFPLSAPLPLAQAVRAGQPVWLNNSEALASHYPALAREGLDEHQSAWAAVPFLVGGKAVGALGLGFAQSRTFTPDERAFVLALAEQCALALERARLYSAEHQARVAAEAARRRLAFLAEASQIVVSTLDYAEMLQQLARLVVPDFADACFVDVQDEDGHLRQLALECCEPALIHAWEALRARYPFDAQPKNALSERLRQGEPLFLPAMDAALLRTIAQDDEHLRLWQALRLGSALAVPLRARGRNLGVIYFGRLEPNPAYAPEDQALAEELARRAAMAVDNGRLYAQAQQLNAELEVRVAERTQELRELGAHMESLREEERARIAREVHDELGGSLTAIKMDASRLRRELADMPEGQARVQAMLELIDTTVQSVRRIAMELRPAVLDDLGLVPALEWQLMEFQRRSGIACTLHAETDGDHLAREAATGLFRIFQETLTNIARHAQASQVNVTLRDMDGHFELHVQDNGRGIAADELAGKKSLGVLGMRERVRLLGGEIEIAGPPGQGTRVCVKVPRQA